ncbi:MAG: glycoside hydrolase family 88 protein [Bacteroidales bacterium]|nr:glycoside hydrolase family 88 protein [Bacteroidales bacterium]
MTRYIKAALLCILIAVSTTSCKESLKSMIDRDLKRAEGQALILAKNLEDNNEALPRTWENGELKTTKYSGWVSGFFPGVLWMLYEQTGQEDFKKYAEIYTDRVEPAKKMTSTHDLGFMLMSSFGQGYRITGNPHYLEVIHEGADSLLTRWNPSLGVMQSWKENSRWKFPVIIDNMMNLEMLCFCTKQFEDSHYEEIAKTHANTTIKNHFREDNSTWHVVSYDPEAGGVQVKNTAQGYSDDSAWARGQSWGLYGYTMMYRETKDETFLEQAKKIARFLVNHPNLPEDKIPCWDYNAPGAPDTQRDASSGAIMASALIELSQLDPGKESSTWLDVAIQQLRTLSTPEYLAEPGENGGFILKHSVGSLPGNSEVDVPLTYADYYFIEALLRLKELLAK